MAGGVFSDRDIFEAREKGEIAIDPFVDSHVKGSSVDVRVGHYYYRTEGSAIGGIYNPFDPDGVKKYFGKVQEAISHEQYIDENGLQPQENIPLKHPVIVLEAGQRILAHTFEFIGSVPGFDITTMMKARSSTGRNGFSVCHDAGWGDPGYFNRWTMEVQNINNRSPLLLPVGIRVAQLVFFRTGPVMNAYRSKYQSGDYKGLSLTEALEKIKADWVPSQMLPRTYKDIVEEVEPIEGMQGRLK